MHRKVSSMFNGGIAGLNLLVACLLTLAAFFAAPSLAEAATGQLSTINWRNSAGTQQGYELEATAVTTNLATVSLSGPTISGSVSMYPVSNENGVTVYKTKVISTRPQVGDIYTIKIVYVDNVAPMENISVYVSAVLGKNTALDTDNFPTPTGPSGAVPSLGPPTFSWNSPKTIPANFAGYSVAVTGPDFFEWYTEVPTTENSTIYTGSSLTPGATHEWAIATMDVHGNKAEIRGSSFLVGANFTGKVTKIDGSPLAGIEVRATEPTTMLTYPSTFTAADGTYLYTGLPPGKYKLDFDLGAYYYKHKLDFASGTLLEVVDGQMITNVNATIGGWGAISGNIYLPGYKLATGAQVALLDSTKAAVPSVEAVAVTLKSGYGSYYMAPVRPGTYYLRFSGPGYVTQDKQVVVTENKTLQNVPEVTATLAALPVTLTVQNTGQGYGTVTSSGISCTTGSTCTKEYPLGTPVTLYATTSAGSVFGGWSGACTGTGNCQVTVDSAKNVTATFNTKPATVRIDGSSTPYFSIGSALDALLNVSAPQTVRAKALELFTENVVMATPAQVTFIGGYTDTADTFTNRPTTSRSIIRGSLKIRKGKLIPNGLAIR